MVMHVGKRMLPPSCVWCAEAAKEVQQSSALSSRVADRLVAVLTVTVEVREEKKSRPRLTWVYSVEYAIVVLRLAKLKQEVVVFFFKNSNN
jgi:hypothetical protein